MEAMNEREWLKEVNDKYYPIIKEKYGKYVKNFSQKGAMTDNVRFFDSSQEKKAYKGKTLIGNCDRRNGRIYLNKDKMDEHSVVHEYIHRLSRNRRRKCFKINPFTPVLGIHEKYHGIDFSGMNEVITEWLTYQITHIQKDTSVYQVFFSIITDMKKNAYYDEEQFLYAYFTGKTKYFYHYFRKEKHINRRDLYVLLSSLNDIFFNKENDWAPLAFRELYNEYFK